ncbi:MAG TPA: glycosyltransferase family 39 protein [Thermoleophilia bacterium]|nr:glycosyltransferase family 39 protein [Thermoleophilia bacterium]
MHRSRSVRTTNGLLAAIAGLAAVALLPWLGKPAYPDELASLHAARLGWTQLWQHSHIVDLVLLPYYSLLHLWTELSGSVEWARILSLLAFGLTVFLVGHLGARLGGRLCAVLAAIVAATNPLLVTAALSARPYALSALAATAAVATLFRWLEGGGTRWAWLLCAASIATLCLHLFAVLAPLSALVAAIAFEARMFRGRWRTLFAPLGLVLTAALVVASLGAGQRSQIAWIPTQFGGAHLRRAIEGPASGGHTPYTVFVLAVALVTVAACLWTRSRSSSAGARLDLRPLAIVLAWAALPTITLVAGSLVQPLFLDRYVTASAPGLAIAIALPAVWAIRGSDIRLVHRSRAVAGGVMLGVATVALFLVFSVPAARLTYAEAISQATPRVRRVASPVAREDRRVATVEQTRPVRSHGE